MHRFILRDDDLESAFVSLSKQLPASIVNNTLHIPQHRGNGLIKNIPLEEGLHLRYTRLRYYEDIEVIRLAKQPDSEVLFSLCILLTPSWSIFLCSNNTRLSAQIPEGRLSHTIELLFSRDWLYTNLAGMEDRIGSVSTVIKEGGIIPIEPEAPLLTEGPLLEEIESELNRPLFSSLSIRSRVLTLLANIFSRLPARPFHTPIVSDVIHPMPISREAHYIQTIRKVEQRLVRSLEQMLPSQKELAKEFALSESTLKRQFKAVYGKTMYDYYLGKKMDLAKWLIQEKKISVSETAYMLGYEKVSAFIIIFKKHHNVLPSSLK